LIDSPKHRRGQRQVWWSESDLKFDLPIAGAWFVLVAAAVFAVSSWIVPFVGWRQFDNIYFNADIALVFSNMTDPTSNHYRTGMHPLFSLLMCPLVLALHEVTRLELVTAVRLVLGGNAGLQIGLVYLVLRRSALSRFDATLFTLLTAVAAATICWSTVPETFTFGGTTLLVMLAIVAHTRRPSLPVLVAGNLATMSMTLTNWMVGFYATVQLLWKQWRRVLVVFAISFGIMLALGVMSKMTFPSSGYAGDVRRYGAWVRAPKLNDLRSFLVHSVVMPEPRFRVRDKDGAPEVVVEPVGLGGEANAVFSRALWVGLLGTGIAGALRRASNRGLRNVLLWTVASQFLLHMHFADGPFLFSAHFTPLLVLIAAHSALFRPHAWIVRTLGFLLVVLVAHNNLGVFQRLTERLDTEVLSWLERHGSSMSTDGRPSGQQ
jgi:hypothetical protein